MKASTQYNDFTGTSAADISDHTNLSEFLSSQGVDVTRYKPIGAGFYASYEDGFYAAIYCADTQSGTNTKPHVVKIGIDKSILDKDAFFSLFKRMDIEFTIKATDFREAQRSADIEYKELDEMLPE